jgi:hypothetical protein
MKSDKKMTVEGYETLPLELHAGHLDHLHCPTVQVAIYDHLEMS